MHNVELTVFDHGEDGCRRIQTLLEQFEREKLIRVELQVLPWSGGWSKMVSVALYRDGPDISEIGSTWLGDFQSMDALSPFGPQAIYRFGGKERFLESSWASGSIPESQPEPEICWAIPWTVDTRMILYRRDLLRDAEVDESNAFQTPDRFENTLQRLQASGVKVPLAVPTERSRLTLHILASWVWGAGGDFVSRDFSKVLIAEPQALAGLEAYFRLGRFLPVEHKTISETQAHNLFFSGEAAVLISGFWILAEPSMKAIVRENLGVAAVPGVPFVGGTHLVIWRHSLRRDAALQLIQFLVNSREGFSLYPAIGLPARLDGYEQGVFASGSGGDPLYRSLGQMVRVGRSFPMGRLWGLVENRLVDLFPTIWEDILAEDEPDIGSILRDHLEPAVQRLSITMQT